MVRPIIAAYPQIAPWISAILGTVIMAAVIWTTQDEFDISDALQSLAVGIVMFFVIRSLRPQAK